MRLFSVRVDRSYLLVLVAGCLCLRAAVVSAADLRARWTWKPVRIGAGGWMRGMVINPQNPNIRFARGDVDNAYRWDGASNMWVPMKIASALPGNVVAAPTAAGGSALAYDPSDANVVLCAYSFQRSSDITGMYPNIAFNVYRSTDGGRTFTAGNLSLSGDTVNEEQGERLAIDPNNGKIVYLGTPSNGLYRSMDGGLTWGAVSGGPGAARFPRFDAGAGTTRMGGQMVSKRLYCTTTGGPVYQSDDGGLTWGRISTGQGVEGHPGFATVDQGGNLWIAQDSDKAGSATIYKYTRAGVWSSHITPHGPVNGIAVDPRETKRVFVMTAGGSLARSNDGGNTWTSLGGSLSYSDTQTIQWLRPSPIRPNGHYESTSNLNMDKNGSLWVSGGNDGVLTCTPNDATDSSARPPVWSGSSSGIEEMVGQECVIPPGGIPILTVEDETCFTIQNPDTFNALHFDVNLWNGNNGLSSGQDVNYCPNQPKFVVCTTANVFTANPASANYAAYSVNGGRNWTRFESITAGKNPAPLYSGVIAVSARRRGHQNDAPGGDNIVWIGSNIYSQNSPAPFYSTDGGRIWTQTQSFNNAPGAFVYHGYEYMGKQWGPWNPSLKVHSLEADPLMPGVFYANLTAGGFWKSTDGGKTWFQPPVRLNCRDWRTTANSRPTSTSQATSGSSMATRARPRMACGTQRMPATPSPKSPASITAGPWRSARRKGRAVTRPFMFTASGLATADGASSPPSIGGRPGIPCPGTRPA